MAFRDVLKQRRTEGQGLISSLASAAYGSTRESLDIKNTLFKSGSILNALFPNVKGYKAVTSKTSKTSSLSSLSGVESSLSFVKLDEINRNTSVAAKNSVVLPKMAMDINLMKLNIMKLVSAAGKPVSRQPDMFFASAKQRENLYESQFGKKTTTTPIKVGDENKKSGGMLGLLSIIPIVSGVFGTLSKIVGGLFSPLLKLSGLIIGVLTALSTFSKGIFKILVFLGKSRIGKLLGLGALALGISNLKSETNVTGVPDVQVTEDNDVSGKLGGLEKTIVGAGAGIAAYSGVKGAITTKRALTGTKTAILDAKTMSVSQLSKSTPQSKWGKFLAFVAKKSPKLWGKIGLKLAQAGALATIPIAGWILAAVQLGFSLWTAWEVYELWREFTNTQENDTSPTPSSPEIDDLLGAIGKAEGGSMGYDAINRGKAGDTPGGMPGLSNMSVGEVMKLQEDKKVFAAGKYQIIPSTLKGLVDSGVVKREDKFDSATQDKLANELIQRRLAKAGDDPIKQQFELSKEFASIANPYTGVSYYAGRGNNKASIASIFNNPSRGSLLNNGSIAMADSRMNLSTPQQVVLNAPQTTNVQQPSSGGMSGGLPSVVDQDFMKYLVGRAS